MLYALCTMHGKTFARQRTKKKRLISRKDAKDAKENDSSWLAIKLESLQAVQLIQGRRTVWTLSP